MAVRSSALYARRSRGYGETRAGIALLLVLVFLVPIIHIIAWESTVSTHTVTVEDKDRVANADGGSESRIYTDEGVFAVGDDPLKGQWNSADTYASLKPGGTYEVTTVGWRLGLLSLFPNIIRVEEV